MPQIESYGAKFMQKFKLLFNCKIQVLPVRSILFSGFMKINYNHTTSRDQNFNVNSIVAYLIDVLN